MKKKIFIKITALAVAGCLFTLSMHVNVFAEEAIQQEGSGLTDEDREAMENRPSEIIDIDTLAEWQQAANENTAYVYTCYYDIPGTWIQEADGRWWYHHKNGGYTKEAWERINGKWYYFNAEGYMCTGWLDMEGRWFYLGTTGDGAMKTGWQQVNGTWYYMNASGVLQYSWQFINGKWYYFNSDGAMVTGWLQRKGKWYYLGESGDGAMKSGWQQIGDKWYYLGTSGDGAMVTGWLREGNTWYYLKEDRSSQGFSTYGSMAANEDVLVNGIVYFFDSSGKWIEK